MENCLIDYIGFQVCAGEEPPASNLYINTLPGISLESIDKIADAEQVTYWGVWQDAQIAAWPRFKQGFISELLKCYTITRSCDYEDLICDNKEYLATAWMYLLGNQLMIYRLYTSRLNRYTTIDYKLAEQLKDFYQVEYEKELTIAIKLVDVTGCCKMEESNNPQRVIWLP
jgi:hypothetical protein